MNGTAVVRTWIGCAMAALAMASAAAARDLPGRLPGETLLRAAEGPFTVPATVVVPAESRLIIEAGTELRFGPEASLVIEGTLLAVGERRLPIRFGPLVAGERWGNVKILGDKDLPSYDGDGVFIEGGGSRLEFCEFRGAGAVPDESYDGGALYLNGSAPLIRNCLFEGNRAERGGGIVAYNFATPRIEDCTFEDNEALLDDGGAIYCFFYSDAIIARNFIVRNHAARHGGGIYVSVSDPLIRENALIDNSSGGWGGAVYVSASSPQILDNALFEHQAGERATGLVFQTDCQPLVRGNSLLSGGSEVQGLNLSYDIDLSGNWWGTADELQITSKVRQRGRGRDKVLAIAPWLVQPPPNLLTQPVEIHSLHAMADRAWSDTLAFDLVEGALARIEIIAVDRNPYAIDQTAAEVSVLERPEERLVLILRETEKASGIFRARLAIGRGDEEHPLLAARVGEHVLLRSSADEGVKRLYRVDEARPVVHSLAIVSDPDPTHITERRVRVAWEYFDLLGNPQQGWQMQVSEDPGHGRTVWDSGAQSAAAEIRALTYGGAPLRDGERYFFRLRVQGGGAWSAWRDFLVRSDNAEFSFRLNSLPPVPALLQPAADEILPLHRPPLVVQEVTDREGDPVRYEFQLAADEFFQRPLAASDAASWSEARWTPPLDLEDNGRYWWRVRVNDSFETGEWSPARGLWLNPLEEAPAPFALLEPEGTVADVRPTFRWEQAHDPDPGARLHYRLLAGSREDLGDARVIADRLEAAEWRPREPYANLSVLHWAVEAVDNTDRSVRSRRPFRLVIDTTPSVPVALFPGDDEEIRAHETFRIEPSVDPWPEDQLRYEIQLSGDGDFSRPLLHWRQLALEDLAATGVDAYPETRLLTDDSRYFWRVRAVDNHDAASDWSRVKAFWFNRRNNPPSVPAGLEPAAGTVIRDEPLLAWQPSSDPDQSDPPASLGYVLQLSEREDFSGSLIEERLRGVATRLGLGTRLGDDRRWFWRVEAIDDEGQGSGWSEVRWFVVNAVENPPAAFTILEPGAEAVLVKLDGLNLAWQESRDPDWNSRVVYDWALAADEDFARPLASGRSPETAVRVALALESRRDYWARVVAVDDTGLETPAPLRHFRVDSHPLPPRLHPLAAELGPADEIRWDAAEDPDPDDRLLYRLRLLDAGGRALVDLADWPGTAVTLGRLPGAERLPDDRRLTLALAVRDPHGLGAESDTLGFWYNAENDPPTAPALLVEPGSVLRSTTLALPFEPGQDPDHSDPVSSLRHELQVSDSPRFDSPLVRAVPPGLSRVEGLVLADNARWHLRLRALDNDGAASPWSPALTVIVNTVEDPPSTPQIQQPAAGAELHELDGFQLAFEAATDPDVDAVLVYRAELRDEAGSLVAERRGAETQLRWALPLNNGTSYRLRVVAVDDTGLETPSAERSFRVDSTPSGMTLGGADGQVLGPDDALGWNPASDPDPRDKLVYELQVDGSRGFAGAPVRETAQTVWPLRGEAAGLPENGEAFARVRARDSHGLTGPWSPLRSFIWDAVNEAPVWVGELSPPSGRLPDNEPRIGWQPPQDPDRRRQTLVVELQVAADENFAEVLASQRVPAAEGGVRQTLRENEVRWARARAVDQDGAASAWSPARRWEINAREEAPTAPGLRAPAEGASLRGEIRFRWQDGSDPDPGDRVEHRIELEGPEARRQDATGGEASLSLPAGDWRWRVVARDGTGLETASPWRALVVLAEPQD
jgi:hypothetical protein